MAGEDVLKIGTPCPFCSHMVRFRVVFGNRGQFRAEHDPDYVCKDYWESLSDSKFLAELLHDAKRL